jgi:opacity protein-like surface antigen
MFKTKPVPLKEEWNNIKGLRVNLGYSKNQLDIGGAFSLSGTSFDEQKVRSDIEHELGHSVEELTFDVDNIIFFHAELYFRYVPFPVGFSPYFLAGAGFLGVFGGQGSISNGNNNLSFAPVDDDAISLRFGTGIQYKITNSISLYSDISFLFGFGLGDNYALYPVNVGLTFPISQELFNALL